MKKDEEMTSEEIETRRKCNVLRWASEHVPGNQCRGSCEVSAVTPKPKEVPGEEEQLVSGENVGEARLGGAHIRAGLRVDVEHAEVLAEPSQVAQALRIGPVGREGVFFHVEDPEERCVHQVHGLAGLRGAADQQDGDGEQGAMHGRTIRLRVVRSTFGKRSIVLSRFSSH